MKWCSTDRKGVRFRQHITRKHGVGKDKYYAIRYQRDGKRKEEGLGWASEGWTLLEAETELDKLKKAHARGEDYVPRLSDKRKAAKKKAKKKELDALTFNEIFDKHYFPNAKADKDLQSHRRESGLFTKWIKPVIGPLPLADVAPIHIGKIKQRMKKANLAPRSIVYALAVVRQVYNYSIENKFFRGVNPVSAKIKKITKKQNKTDNKRLRFMTISEAETLISELKKEPHDDVWEQVLISLHTGLRASEIFRLKWVDIDVKKGLITVKGGPNTKSKSRHAYMTEAVKSMFLDKETMFLDKKNGKLSDLIFTTPAGKQRREVSRVFERVVADLKFNDGVDDRRDRVVFHTCRHSYASWLVQAGESLYVVKERLGHSTLAMTERYSHLAPGNAKKTVSTLEKIIKQVSDINRIKKDVVNG